MKITKITVTPINIRNSFHYVWSAGVLGGFSRSVIQVETDEGITGLGETTTIEQGNVVEDIAPLLTGKNPLDIVECELACLPEWKTLSITGGYQPVVAAFGAIDMALWDIKGKTVEQPLYQLLGGAYRKEIAFTEYFGLEGLLRSDGTYKIDTNPESVVEYCVKTHEEHGSTFFEGKIAMSDDIWHDIKIIHMLREQLGKEVMIRLDANYGYSLPTAKLVCKHLEECDIRNIEDPVSSYEDMAELKKFTPMSISTHLSDLRRAVYAGAPDNFCIHPVIHGGIMNTIRFIGACEQFGKGVWFYSGDTGIATAVYMHLSAACQHITEPSQSLLRWTKNDVIEGGPFNPKNNVLLVPEEPGIGVTLDKQALAAAHKDYIDNGPVSSGYYNFKKQDQFVRMPRC